MECIYLSKVNKRWIALFLFVLIKFNAVAQIYANSQTNGKNGLCLVCGTASAGNAIDSDLDYNYSTLGITVGALGAQVYQRLSFPIGGVAGDFIGIVIEAPNAGLLDIVLLGSISITTYDGGSSNNDTRGSGGIFLGLLSGSSSKYVVQFKSTMNFDAVEFRLNGGLASTLSSMRVYYAAFGQTPLPVNFSYFNAESLNSLVHLKWGIEKPETQGTNIIERSTDGLNFTEIASFPSNHQTEFEFTDQQPLSGKLYYRITFKEESGEKTLSDIVCVTINNTEVSFYPNPFARELIIETNDSINPITIIISTMDGKSIYSNTFIGLPEIKISDLGSIENGIYRIELKSNTQYTSNVLVKN